MSGLYSNKALFTKSGGGWIWPWALVAEVAADGQRYVLEGSFSQASVNLDAPDPRNLIQVSHFSKTEVSTPLFSGLIIEVNIIFLSHNGGNLNYTIYGLFQLWHFP